MATRNATSVGMVINSKKCAIQLNSETSLQEYLLDIPRMDETTYKCLLLEMMREKSTEKR